MGVKGQFIFSHYVGGSTLQAVEIQNVSGATQTLTSTNFQLAVNTYSGNPKIAVWSLNTGEQLTLEANDIFVVLGNASGTAMNALASFLDEKGVPYFVSSLPFEDGHPVIIQTALKNGTFTSGNGSSLVYTSTSVSDMLGEFYANNSTDFLPTGKNDADDYIWEREFDYLTQGLPSGTSASTDAFNSVYGISAGSVATPTPGWSSGSWDGNDFEGFGCPISNIKFTGGNWISRNPLTSSKGSIGNTSHGTTFPGCTSNCIIESENSTEIFDFTSSAAPKGLVLNPGQTVYLRANASNQAKSKIKKRKATGSYTVNQERYLLTPGYHYLGAPAAEGFSTNNGNNSSNAHVWWWGPNQAGTAMTWIQGTPQAGLGVLAIIGSNSKNFANTSTVFSVEGTPISSFEWNTNGSGDAPLYDLDDGFSATGNEWGWNTLSNPFNVDLNWSDLWDATTGLMSTVYIWDPQLPGWKQFNAAIPNDPSNTMTDGIIPPMSAFEVQVAGPGSTSAASLLAKIDLHTGSTSASNSYNKTYNGPDILNIKVYPSNNPLMHDGTTIANRENATAEFDDFIDGWKRINSNGRPAIYQTTVSGDLSSNNIDLTMPQSVEIGLDELTGGSSYTIELSQMVSGNDYHVSLEDVQLNMNVNLNSNSYTFTSSGEGELDNRFILHINQNSMDLDESNNGNLFVYSVGQDLYINTSNKQITKAEVFSVNGELLFSGKDFYGVEKICTLNSGIYFIQLQGMDMTQSFKILH